MGPRTPEPVTTYDELLARAEQRLPAPVLEYVVQGAGDGLAAGEAEAGWRQHRVVPRVLRDVTDVHLATTWPTGPVDLPWGIAPTTLRHHVHPDGELAMARAAARLGVVCTVSSNAGAAFAEIGETGARWWLQAYLPQERSLADGLLRRAVDAGAEGVVLTVDTPVVGTKRHAGRPVWDLVAPGSLRTNFDPSYDDDDPAAAKALDLGPADVERLASVTGLPVVVKGVLHPDDAALAVDAGAAGVWVSNHGGRQLARAAGTAACLPDVVAAVAGRVPVLVDGGLRSGEDLLVAFALGADGVMLGRPPLLALVDGEDGVVAWGQRLSAELVEALRLAGCTTVEGCRELLLRRG